MNAGMFILATLSVLAAETSTPTEKMSWDTNETLKSGYRSAPWVRDPFFGSRSLKVTGIISGKLAFIENQWVGPGDRVGRYTVKAIMKNGVRLADEFKVLFLPMTE